MFCAFFIVLWNSIDFHLTLASSQNLRDRPYLWPFRASTHAQNCLRLSCRRLFDAPSVTALSSPTAASNVRRSSNALQSRCSVMYDIVTDVQLVSYACFVRCYNYDSTSFDGWSTNYQRSLRSQWRNTSVSADPLAAVIHYIRLSAAATHRSYNSRRIGVERSNCSRMWVARRSTHSE